MIRPIGLAAIEKPQVKDHRCINLISQQRRFLMALPFKSIIVTTVFAVFSSQAFSQASWDFKAGTAYIYGRPGHMSAATFGESGRSLLMKHATKVPKNTMFFMNNGELYSASGMDPLSDIHLE